MFRLSLISKLLHSLFIQDFDKLASPLNQLLKKDICFPWSGVQECSFQDLKTLLTEAPVLAFPDFSPCYKLYTYASSLGLGATLMQKNDRGKNRVIADASRVLNSAEANYSATHQGALAVVWALTHFRDLLLGYSITVFADHAAVTNLFKGRNLSGRLERSYLTIP